MRPILADLDLAPVEAAAQYDGRTASLERERVYAVSVMMLPVDQDGKGCQSPSLQTG